MDAAAVDPRLPAIVAAVAEVLGDDLLSLILHGSAVHGGLRPRSDLDLIAVVRASLDEHARRALVAAVLPLSGRWPMTGPQRPIELTVVVAGDVRPPGSPPTSDLQYGEWRRDDVENGVVLERRPDPDLAVLLTVARGRGRTLLGAAPDTVMAAPPLAAVLAAGAAGVPALLADLDEDGTNVLLTLARIAATRSTGEIVPKDEAAAWALPLLPAALRGPLAHARARYLGADLEEVRGDVARATATALADPAFGPR